MDQNDRSRIESLNQVLGLRSGDRVRTRKLEIFDQIRTSVQLESSDWSRTIKILKFLEKLVTILAVRGSLVAS